MGDQLEQQILACIKAAGSKGISASRIAKTIDVRTGYILSALSHMADYCYADDSQHWQLKAGLSKSEDNAYAAKALELVRKGKSVFITGKAGTGKTTLLRQIHSEHKKRKQIAILAPTGVAAKNAGGVTIHSFLRLPLSLYLPGLKLPGLFALNKEEIEIVRRTDMIIIDEVSMVRCDLLDKVDAVLRHYRKNETPFGGVQMIFFGDLYQLMPVVDSDEWDKLKEVYSSPYFFSSKVYEEIKCPMLELKKVYRQQDTDFVRLLNSVRNGNLTLDYQRDLDGRYKKSFDPDDSEGYIRLTTHNKRAYAHNMTKLESLPDDVHEFKAYIDGWFPKDEFPTNYVLELKKGARVMFVRNDNNSHLYVNGTLGTIVGFSGSAIEVKTDEGKLISVYRQNWDFDKYHINKTTKEIEIEHCGSFSQYPLKLAWSITIHKSQGLTFDKVIIDAGRAFTYGQVYVALSRCRKFYGIVLVSPIVPKIVKTDPVVVKYMEETKQIVIEDAPEENTDERQEPPQLLGDIERTYHMVRDGLTFEEIVRESKLRVEIIYAHLSKLIGLGLIDIDKYLSPNRQKIIASAIEKAGKDAKLIEIRNLCSVEVKFGEITMVQANLSK